MFRALLILSLSSLAAAPSVASTPPRALDGEGVPFKDDLAEKLAGDWQLTGTVMGQPARQRLSARWTLAHQFLVLHFAEVDATKPAGELYEANVLGYGPRKVDVIASSGSDDGSRCLGDWCFSNVGQPPRGMVPLSLATPSSRRV